MESMKETLCKELNTVIEKSDATYGDTVAALKKLLWSYENKGEDLLNGVKIQEVAAVHPKNPSAKLP